MEEKNLPDEWTMWKKPEELLSAPSKPLPFDINGNHALQPPEKKETN